MVALGTFGLFGLPVLGILYLIEFWSNGTIYLLLSPFILMSVGSILMYLFRPLKKPVESIFHSNYDLGDDAIGSGYIFDSKPVGKWEVTDKSGTKETIKFPKHKKSFVPYIEPNDVIVSVLGLVF